ncbi:MAG: polyprenyl synthetase family protein [Lachnospiraceae bacterium]|nr:polyprenyl synthetase family protein [Lachnospiraceae bacterium]
MNFNEKLTEKVSKTEETVLSFLPKEEGYQKTVIEAMNYSVLAGGKRLRPLLMNEVYSLFGGDNKLLVGPFMAAMEMIHTYSLVHDDLPAMDNDEYRRGKKTTHVVFGEAMGILAGDALLNYAYETALCAFDACDKEDRASLLKVIRALKLLSKKAGIYGMVGGQVKDVELTENGEAPDAEELDFIHNLKTGALIEASMMIGAVLAGAGDEEIEIVGNIASKIGMAFQIQDDILDVIGDEAALGKPIGSDDKNNKVTYVTLYGIDKAKTDVEALTGEAVELLKGLGRNDDFLEDLLLWLVNREK